MILPKSDIQLIRDEIQQKAGSLWGDSVQRIRDKAVGLAFHPQQQSEMGAFSVPLISGEFVTPHSLGTKMDDLIDDYSNTYPRHMNVDDLRELHYETSFVNTAFYRYIVDPLTAGSMTKNHAKKRLSSLRDTHLPRIYKASKDLLETIHGKHAQLASVATHKIHSPNDLLDLTDEVAEYLDFMFCLCTPPQAQDPIADRDMFVTLSKALNQDGKIVLEEVPDLKDWITKEVPNKFQAWYDDVSANLEAWWQQAQKSYGKVLDQLSFNAENN